MSVTTKMLTVPQNNYMLYVSNALNGQSAGTFTVGQTAGSAGLPDPAPNCSKLFSASYTCGTNTKVNVATLDKEAYGKTATFDCSKESAKCAGFRLTIGDDGNLVLTNGLQERTWQSNTSATGLSLENRSAKKSKYGRNYLKQGDALALGEFIGSPSGNCYLIMETDETTKKAGLQLRYDYPSCENNNNPNSVKIYTIPKQHVSNIGKVGYVSEDGKLHEYPADMVTAGSGFMSVGRFDSIGNTINQSTQATVDGCKTKCSTLPDCAGFVYGSKSNPMVRYIRVTPNEGLGTWNERQALQISQIAAYSQGVNVAFKKATTSGPRYLGFPAEVMDYPVDGTMAVGSKRPNGLFYHSAGNAGDFYQIDLGMEYPLERIVYYSRGDYWNWRAAFQNLTVLDSNKTEIKRFPLTTADVQTLTLTVETAGLNQCFLKNSNMYPNGNRQPSTDYELYMRGKTLTNNNSCSKEYKTTNTQTWEMYPMGDKMSMDTLCSLGAATEQEQKELARKRRELDALAAKIKQKLSKLRQTDGALVHHLDNNVQQIEKDLDMYKGLEQQRQNNKVATRNVDGMQEDSSLILSSQMYQHILYSILAVLVVMSGTLAYKKLMD